MRLFAGFLTLGLVVGASGRAEPPPQAADPRLFEDQVRQILTSKCLTCHASDAKKGGLDLTRRAKLLAGGESGAAVVAGKPEESLLIEKLEAGEMPPKNPLNAEQVRAFRTWVEAGAHYSEEPLVPRRAGPDWWSLRPVGRPALPGVEDRAGWIRTPIDAFVLARLAEQKVQPQPEADRVTLIRRASFDLIGLPPTPDEVEAFVNDPDPEAYGRLIERLLASPHYGERWGRHWLDVVRFGESEGYEMNHIRPNAWPFRDYVIRAFNSDTPLPRFALEQLAGDTLPEGDWLTRAATGFLVGGTHDEVGNATVEGQRQQRMDDLDDMITATGSAFLGLTINCARCHDHKFDPITQKDYHAFQAVFAGVQHGERAVVEEDTQQRRREAAAVASELVSVERQLDDLEPLAHPHAQVGTRPMVNAKRNVERFEPVEARLVRFTILATNDGTEPCIDELEVWGPEGNIAIPSAAVNASASSEFPNASIHKIVHLNDGLYGNGRSWISREPGKGWAQLDLARVHTIDRVIWGRDREEKYKDRLATDYRVEVAIEPGKWRVVATSNDRHAYQASGMPESVSSERSDLLERQRGLRTRLEELSSKHKVYAGTFRQPDPTHLLRRGDVMQPGDEVVPAGLSAVKPSLVMASGMPESERRAALARWIGAAENPLPARVMVNRVWHYHFGRGLVSTPGDFGFNGGRPSHPELLDWLARYYIESGFALKPIHRLIMLSATYRQSSRADDHALKIDRDNQFLWRMSPRRLEAEPLRDAILSASGQLDRRVGGPGYDLWENNTNYVHVYQPKVVLGPPEFRRMVYQFRPRSQLDPTLGAFDCPDSALVMPRRTVSTTALQALNLLNSSFVVAQGESFAVRLRREMGDDPTRQAERGFLLAFGRRPSDKEWSGSVALIRAQGTAAFCRALYNANEFLYVP